MSQVLKLVLVALFLAIGTILDAVVPSFPMKPDLLLSMMFLAIFLFADRRNFLIIGLAAGLLSGLTSTMPGGFLPNVIDKIITATVIFAVYSVLRLVVPKLINAIVLTALGTVLSGTVFLGSLGLIASLPPKLSFMGLFLAVVLPAAAINAVLMAVVYPIIERVMKNSFSNQLSTPKNRAV
jgi:hypothetical protein